MRIAIITAMAEETLPIIKKLGNVTAEDVISGVRVRQIETEAHTVYLCTTGIGEVRAALAVQMLADLFDVETVLNFGFVGSLDPSLKVGELVMAERVCHYQFDISAVNGLPVGCYDGKDEEYFDLDRASFEKIRAALSVSLRGVSVASGDKFIASTDDKNYLRNTFGADICEMELAGLAIACERNNIPLISVKVISDGADESATVSFAEVLEKGLTKYEQILPQIFSVLGSEGKPMPPAKVDAAKKSLKKV